MERDAFTFYKSFYEAAQEMSDKDRLAFYDAIIKYAFTEAETPLKGIAKMAFTLAKPNLDSGLAGYKGGKGGGRGNKKGVLQKEGENKKGGFSESEEIYKSPLLEKATQNKKQQEQEYKQEQEIKERDTNVSPKKKFQKPTVDEVRAYCEERHNAVDPDAFVDFYESKGWKVGDQPMKDWKAAVRTWERSESKRGQPQRGQAMKGQQRGTDYDAMIAQSVMPDRYTDRSRDFIRRNMGGLMEAT